MKWNVSYEDRSRRGVDFSHPPEVHFDYLCDDITDYHRHCVETGRSAYYRLLYWSIEQIDSQGDYEHTH